MYKLEFTLRQHTPLIHFQWYEDGASIRPTELKAKLDKWLIAQATNCHGNADERLKNCLNNPELKKWLKGAKDKDKMHPTFNYSISVRPIGDKHLSEVTNSYPTYFGNQGNAVELNTGAKRIKKLVFHSVVQVIFNSQFAELIDKIKEVFPLFILKTNFGTRQGKGFGSFYLDRNDPCFPKEVEIENEISNKFDWKFDIKVSGNDEPTKIRDLFRQIDLFYKTLRSGISPNDRPSMYFKSMMWKYAQHLNRQWDKRTIKQIHFNRHILSQTEEHKDNDSPLLWDNGEKVTMNFATTQNPNSSEKTHLLWRDLLGLSTQQTWMSYDKTEVNKSHIKTTKSKAEIARFQSPIFFKPLRSGSDTYRVLFEVPFHLTSAFKEGGNKSLVMESQILGEWFKISGSNNELMLPYPEYFNFTDFFKFIFSINLREYIMDGTNIYSFERGERVLRNKRHGSKIRERENNNWVEKTNPDYLTIQQIYAQLAMQVIEIQPQKNGE